MMVPNLTLTVSRDGDRELIDQTGPARTDSPKGFHLRSLYDFKAHKLYAWDLINTARPCSVSDYPDSAAPPETDVVTGSEVLLADLRKQKPRSVGSEAVDGVPTHMLELTDPGGGAVRLWVSDRTNYILKWVSLPRTGSPIVQLEVSHLTFTAPPAETFAMPESCR
jgi:hypothetical protein